MSERVGVVGTVISSKEFGEIGFFISNCSFNYSRKLRLLGNRLFYPDDIL
jgi:hypothetical protein